MRIFGSKVGPDGVMIGESLGVVARLLGDPGEDQMENLLGDELRLWGESRLGDRCLPRSGVAGRYWYGLREDMASRLVVLPDCLGKRAANGLSNE